MFKKYIRNIVKEEINYIRLGSKTYWEDNFKCKLKHTESLFKEIDKENSILKEQIAELKQENAKLKKQNEISQPPYNFILNDTISGLEGSVRNKERIIAEIGLMLNEQKTKNEKLEDKLSKISSLVSKYNIVESNQLTLFTLKPLMNDIENILKES